MNRTLPASRRLILLRHAKSDWAKGVTDLDRPLNARGREAAPRMGAYLAGEGLRPDHVLVSPARRTAETWEAVAPHLDGIESETVPSIYEASAARILEAVRAAPEAAGTLLVVGHNPGLQDLALLLTGDGARGSLRDLKTKFPTAALAVLDFPVADWGEIARQGGRLERFVTPKALDAEAEV